MSQHQPRMIQKLGEIERNSMGLSRETVGPIIQGLNKALATAYTLYHQYKKHHWLVVGPQFRDLHLFLDVQAKGTLESSDQIAERVTALGGVPLSSPAAQQKEAAFTFEEEGSHDIRSSLLRDQEAEKQMVLLLRREIAGAEKPGDFGTSQLLREILLRHEDQAHHIEHFLGDDTLERSGAQ